MNKEEDLIRIYSGSEISVIHLKGELEEAGVESMIQNDFQSGVTAGFMGGVPSANDLYVRRSDLSKADPIVREFLKNIG